MTLEDRVAQLEAGPRPRKASASSVFAGISIVLPVVAVWLSYRADSRSAAAEQSSRARTLNSAFVLGKTVGNVFGHGLVDERTPPSGGGDNDGSEEMIAWAERHLPWIEARATPSAEWLGLSLDFRHTLREVWLTTDHFAQYRWQEGVFTPVDLELRDLELPMMPAPLPFSFDHHRWMHDLFWKASGPVQRSYIFSARVRLTPATNLWNYSPAPQMPLATMANTVPDVARKLSSPPRPCPAW